MQRTRQQHYSGKADWTAIEKLKKAVAIPVIANGDVRCQQDAIDLIKKYGADGVMVGRACLGKPWILAQIDHGKDFKVPNLEQIVLEHLDQMEKYYGNKAIFIARKHIAWYSLGKTGGAAFREKINQITDAQTVKMMVKQFFGNKND